MWLDNGWKCVSHIFLLTDYVVENVITLINKSLQYSTH